MQKADKALSERPQNKS